MVRYATQQTTQPAAAEQQARVSTRSAPPQTAPVAEPASGGARFVQVGPYASRDQAQQAAQLLSSRGLAARVGVYQRDGQELRVVIAGPFGSPAQTQQALGTARAAGFGNAIARN